MKAGSWRASRQTAKEQSGIAQRNGLQTDAAPRQGISRAGAQIFKRGDVAALSTG
jgi:hypothetical protein